MTAPILELEIDKYQKRYHEDLDKIAELEKKLISKDQTIADMGMTMNDKDKIIAELKKALEEKNS